MYTARKGGSEEGELCETLSLICFPALLIVVVFGNLFKIKYQIIKLFFS